MRIVIGLSGGVDSAVAAYRLKAAGHEVIGVFMKNWEDDDAGEYCTSREDFVSAAACAEVLGIELQHINFAQEYRDRVFALFLQELKAGRTPNPDVLCNSEIKFAAFLDSAKNLGAEGIATGHYAKKVVKKLHATAPPSHFLYACADANKDQTYFLYRLLPEQLEKAIFPLAELSKPEVRALASNIGLPNAKRPDSTGICFIGERPFREFLSRYLPKTPGAIVDEHGVTIGEHQGLAFYTLGQRKGLNIGGIKGAAESAWFVAKKDMQRNVLLAVQGHQHPALLQDKVVAADLHWLGNAENRKPLTLGSELLGKVRHRQTATPCTLIQLTRETITVHFHTPQWAIAPGQSLVLYQQQPDGLACLGGGIMQ